MELIVRQRSGERPLADLATALWSGCATRLPASQRLELRDVRPGPSADGVVLVLDRTVGTHARRRLVGCLEDTVLDLVQADVVRLSVDP